MTQLVTRREDGVVLILTLNAPQLRNAISVDMREQLLVELRNALANRECRAIVLTGADGYFSSGGQVSKGNGPIDAPDPARTRFNLGILHDIVRILAGGAKPTVAAVDGCAYGAGLSLAVACDYLVASQTARFCASFGKVGLMPDAGLIWSLPQKIGRSRARELMLTGRVVESVEAAESGLADMVVPSADVMSNAIEVARSFTQTAPLASAMVKTVLAGGPSSLEEVLSREVDLQPALTLSQDYAEGRAAFKERRPPVFRGV